MVLSLLVFVACADVALAQQCSSSVSSADQSQGAHGSPILVSLEPGAKYELTSPAQGVVFDLDGSGVPRTVAWTAPDSDVAFLAIDRDGDGRITSGRELFGDHTLPGVRNGFDALAQMAFETSGVRRGSITSDDPLLAKLLLWTDRNHNGISEADELRPVSGVIAAVGLGYDRVGRKDCYGNLFQFKGWMHIRTQAGKNKAVSPKEDKERRLEVYDVFLRILR